MDDIMKEFIVESSENLDQLDRDFVTLESDPANKDLLSRIFRAVHTIKGTCGFFALSKLESVTHVGESLLSRLRDGHLKLNPDRTSALLSLVDAIRQMIGSIESTGSEGDQDYSVLVKKLTDLQQDSPVTADQAETASVESAAPPPAEEGAPSATSVIVATASPTVSKTEEKVVPVSTTPETKHSEMVADPIKVKPAEGNSGSSLSDSAIRVDVGILDKLMNLVGELVLARNQIVQFTSKQEDSSFIATSQRLNIITSELQEGVMKTRMQPIGNVWSKFPRVVRDVSNLCGKKVRVQMEGQETELDKTIIEAIKDPLTHMVRNSVDHGIETPAERKANGKSEEGCLLLKAYHEGGQVNIEITDDGKGINPEVIKQKALTKGLITPEKSERMSDREVFNMIFLPGFSTAEKVSNISGRGVGMDVVKTNIEKIGGMVDIQSRPCLGTTMKIKIPLTLAIIPSLIVTTGGDLYAIPQASLLELVRLEGDQAVKKIERINNTFVYRLRGKLLPIVNLGETLGLSHDQDEKDEAINIVVLQADDRQFGLIVDDISDTQEIVVKPLSTQLKGIHVFSGATILGDGRLALILDVMGIAQRASVVTELHERAMSEMVHRVEGSSWGVQSMILIETMDGGRMAIPLSEVDRLEKFEKDKVEQAGCVEVVQYRSHILPLVYVSRVLEERRALPRHEISNKTNSLNVVVYSRDDKTYGLVVDRILDILEVSLEHLTDASREGVVGTSIIQDRVTEILDVKKLIEIFEGGSPHVPQHSHVETYPMEESLSA